jgi:hypothetical protein
MRRTAWIFLGVFCLAFGLSSTSVYSQEPKLENEQALFEQIAKDRLATLEEAIVETGILREDIPAIDRPNYSSFNDASLANDKRDVVFVAQFGEEIRVYPQLILVWHEVVNDVINGEKVTITYCPLTGSVIGYKGKVDLFNTSFGLSGMLVNNNSLLYDRSTNSLWPQLLGTAIRGPLKGKSLTRFPLLWTTFQRAMERFPNAKVLSRSTGIRRNYGRDPYGSYSREGTYYDNNVIVHRLTFWDKRLPAKTRVLGWRFDNQYGVVLHKNVAEKGVVNFSPGMTPLVAFYDAELDAVRLFVALMKEKPLTFKWVDGKIFDEQTKSEWTPEGVAKSGTLDELRLQEIPVYNAMWFGWAAYYPDTEIFKN